MISRGVCLSGQFDSLTKLLSISNWRAVDVWWFYGIIRPLSDNPDWVIKNLPSFRLRVSNKFWWNTGDSNSSPLLCHRSALPFIRKTPSSACILASFLMWNSRCGIYDFIIHHQSIKVNMFVVRFFKLSGISRIGSADRCRQHGCTSLSYLG